MPDDRIALAKGMIVVSADHTNYVIIEEIGRGSSCIVYNAYYMDTSGHRHMARLKECYPYHLDIQRRQDGGLAALPAAEKAFEEERKKFEAAYDKNITFKMTLGLINSTMDAVDLFFSNQTWYSVMTCIEGTDYRRDVDENLQSLFIRILTLARIIKKYHDHGVLHLDIKPENIFLIPETREHMVLFDFDSMVRKEELEHETAIRISFSDGYAAPELVRGKRNKICEATDIYSIGALVFYKLFGRTPNALDGAVGVNYDFRQMCKVDERYQPDLFRELSTFLHKTIAPSIPCRYKSIDSMIPVLEKLIRISDIDHVFLYHNFSYNSACFLGREEELREMGEIFDSGQQILFLSGMGGIGKTELAKRYAFENAGKYRKSVFVPFAESLLETFCRDDLRIHGVEREEGENSESYFERKLSVLKTVVSPDDLIILDNFDVDHDDHLERILECPCKFLVTSREDFRDYAYQQIDVESLGDIEELLQLFRVYHPRDYNQKEQEQIEAIIELVDRHTMTVELVAKYIRTTGEHPGTLLKKLMKNEGITSTAEIDVRHRKDRRLRAESINSHLLALFDLSGFTDGQKELIRSLSLLGYVRISKKRFCEYVPITDHEQELETLIRRGWVEYDEISHKISLHQIILDLVYNYMQPWAENCPHIVESMTEYLRQTMSNYAERQIRRKLLDYFLGRVRGKNLAYAELCVSYCENITKKPEYLNLAEDICLSEPKRDAKNLLQRICRMKMQLAGSEQNMFDKMVEEDDFDEEAYWEERSIEICQLAEKAYAYAREFCEDSGFLGKFCVDTACELDGILIGNMSLLVQEERKGFLDRILDLAVALFDDAKGYLMEAEMAPDEKRKLFSRIQKFYDPGDFTALYRCDYYGNAEKAYEYQRILDSLQEPGDKTLYIGNGHTDMADIAREAEERGEYKKAVDYYLKAYEDGTEPYEIVLRQIAHIYLKLDDRNTAIYYLERILQTDKKLEQEGRSCWTYTNYVCCELIDLLLEEKELEKARIYSEELIHYNIQYVEAEDNAYHLKWLVAAYYRLYQMEPAVGKRQDYWKDAVMYFSMFSPEETFPEELVGFLIELADHEEEEWDRIQKAFKYHKRAENRYQRGNTVPFLDYILDLCDKRPEYIQQQVMAWVCYSEDLFQAYPQEIEDALTYAIRARDQYEQSGLEDAYLCSLIHKAIGQCYSDLDQYGYSQALEEMKKCNYLLLAEHDAEEKTEQKQIEIWTDAADKYHYIDHYAMEEICFDRLFAIFDPMLNLDPSGRFDSYWYAALKQVSCYIQLKKWQKARNRITDLYDKLMACYGGSDDEDFIGKNAWKFRDSLIQCAEKLKEAQREKEAFWIYMISIIAGVKGKVPKEWQRAGDILAVKKQKDVLSEISSVLHGTITNKDVDDIINIYERVKLVLEQDGELKELEREFVWFSVTYQYGNIEFKR